jgi:hypothetical protein
MRFERTTVRLPRDLLARARRKAVAEDRTVTSLVEEGLRLVLEENRKAIKAKGILPHSDAVGGPLPGIDISNSAALQEMDDLEYVERMKNFERMRNFK